MELQDLLGCHVDVVIEKGPRERIGDRVFKEAVALWETIPNCCGTSLRLFLNEDRT